MREKPICEFCGTEKRIDNELGGYCCPNYCTFRSAARMVVDLVRPAEPTSTDGREH